MRLAIAKIINNPASTTEKVTRNFSKPRLVWYPPNPPPNVPESPAPRFWRRMEITSNTEMIISAMFIIFSILFFCVKN